MRESRTAAGRETPEPNAAEIYPPREDTFALLPFATVGPGVRLLEIGTGSGLLALTAARSGASVVATDLNRTALVRLRARARDEGLDLAVVRADLAGGLGRFDRILANPPYLPTSPEERAVDRDRTLALDGGPDGTSVLERIVRTLPEHLAPGGEAFVLVSSVQSARKLSAIWKRWRSEGGSAETVAERALEGERLEVWRLTRSRARSRPAPQP